MTVTDTGNPEVGRADKQAPKIGWLERRRTEKFLELTLEGVRKSGAEETGAGFGWLREHQMSRLERWRVRTLRLLAACAGVGAVALAAVKGPQVWTSLESEPRLPSSEERVISYLQRSMYDQESPPYVSWLEGVAAVMPEVKTDTGSKYDPAYVNLILAKLGDEQFMVARDKSSRLTIIDEQEVTRFCAPEGVEPSVKTGILGNDSVRGGFALNFVAYHLNDIKAVSHLCAATVPPAQVQAAFDMAIKIPAGTP